MYKGKVPPVLDDLGFKAGSWHLLIEGGFQDLHKSVLKTCSLQVLKLLEEAVNTGYGAALIIDSSNVDALLGLGDAHLAAGKLLARIGNLALGNAHWKQSTETFMRAVKFLAAGKRAFISSSISGLHNRCHVVCHLHPRILLLWCKLKSLLSNHQIVKNFCLSTLEPILYRFVR